MKFEGDQKPVTYVFTTILVLMSLLSAICFIFLVKFKDRQPVKARPFKILLSSQVLVIIFIQSICFQRLFSHVFPCSLSLFFTHLDFVALENLYVMRVWILWFACKSSLEKNRLFSLDIRELKHESSGVWYLKHKHYVSSKFLRKAFLISICIISLPLFLVFAYAPDIVNESIDDCSSLIGVQWVVMGWTTLCALVCLYFSTKFGPLKDAFFIKSELKFVGFVSFMCCVLWLYIQSLDENYLVFPFSSFLLVFMGITVFFISTIFPLYKTRDDSNILKAMALRQSYQVQNKNDAMQRDSPGISATGSAMTIPRSLNEILTDEKERGTFRQHLVREFCVENLLFYNKCEKFTINAADESRQQQFKLAKEIYDQFISKKSKLQINLSAESLQSAEEKLESVDTFDMTVFDAAKVEVYQLLSRDSFRRYIQMRRKQQKRVSLKSHGWRNSIQLQTLRDHPATIPENSESSRSSPDLEPSSRKDSIQPVEI